MDTKQYSPAAILSFIQQTFTVHALNEPFIEWVINLKAFWYGKIKLIHYSAIKGYDNIIEFLHGKGLSVNEPDSVFE